MPVATARSTPRQLELIWSARRRQTTLRRSESNTITRFAFFHQQCIRSTAYSGLQGLVFSITGHGFGGMLSQIASVDFNVQNIAYYSHAYGSPRVFNAAGAQFYNDRFNGEAGERGISADDQYTEYIPEGPDYAHAGKHLHYQVPASKAHTLSQALHSTTVAGTILLTDQLGTSAG